MYSFNEVKDILIKMCKNNEGYIPTQKYILKSKILPNPKTIQILFIENEQMKYQDYLISLGYKKQNRKSKFNNIGYYEICDLFEKWRNDYGYYPTERDCRKNNWLPNWELIKSIIGDKEYEFRIRFNFNVNPQKEDYLKYEKFFKEESERLGRPLKYAELDHHNKYSSYIPSSRWMINNCPDDNVKSYNELVEYMGFTPRYLMSKELAIKYILDMYHKKGDLKIEYFKIKEDEDQIGITTIYNHWGTFNNMLRDLSFPINWEKQRDLKTYDEMVKDLRSLCEEIYQNEGRRLIQFSDIDKCNYCFSSSMLFSTFKDVYGITLREVIDSLGFELNNSGYGLNYRFNDGELVLSQYELTISNYLRSKGLIYNKDYKKDVYYQTFIDNYKGRRSIDYVIYDKYYIEVAGVLLKKSYDISKEEKNHIKNYKNKLNEKIAMLEKQGLKYYIIYPDDIKNRTLEEIFSFIYE